MGNAIYQVFRSFFGLQKDVRILMLGLDAAGKTSILYKLKLGEVVTTIPTIGFNVESVKYANLNFQVWDVGGQDRIRPLWRHYFMNAQAIVWVVDSCDRARVGESGHELAKLLRERELEQAKLLVLANKQDLPNSFTVHELAQELGLASKGNKHDWYIQATCARSGDGLNDGFDWLAKSLQKL